MSVCTHMCVHMFTIFLAHCEGRKEEKEGGIGVGMEGEREKEGKGKRKKERRKGIKGKKCIVYLSFTKLN